MTSGAQPSTPLDLCVVAARRPDLLDRTLSSFIPLVTSRFTLARVWVNLDPIFGDATDHAATRCVIDRHLPGAVVFEPGTPSFGEAVQRLWLAGAQNLMLHLEDDWVAREAFGPDRVLPLLGDTRPSVTLVSQEHQWNGRDDVYRQVSNTTLFGLQVWRRRVPSHGTSPRFLRPDFARGAAELMQPQLDPEKQMKAGINPALARYLLPYASAMLAAMDGGPLIVDTGRSWRDERKIRKVVIDGKSTWS